MAGPSSRPTAARGGGRRPAFTRVRPSTTIGGRDRGPLRFRSDQAQRSVRNSSTISPSIRFCFQAAATTISVALSCLARSTARESQSSIRQDRRTLIRATPSIPKARFRATDAQSPSPVSNAVACAMLSKDGRDRRSDIRARRRSRSSSTMTRPTYSKKPRHDTKQIPTLTPKCSLVTRIDFRIRQRFVR